MNVANRKGEQGFSPCFCPLNTNGGLRHEVAHAQATGSRQIGFAQAGSIFLTYHGRKYLATGWRKAALPKITKTGRLKAR